MDQHANHELTVGDLSGVVFSAGRVFNDLSVSRPATVEFLRTGSVEGITAEHDLALLEDLRDLAQLVIDHGQAGGSIDTGFVRGVNARISRSGALHPESSGVAIGESESALAMGNTRRRLSPRPTWSSYSIGL